ncbi:unnamed protein product [Oikopleura dioica]|uniref:Uncharacterized protein n=1 Tax=Oikopleura dioica TaxID=34765 RepID=E4YJB9_OIKDI|nr:unnamed protein product [Oikopleura dioica]
MIQPLIAPSYVIFGKLSDWAPDQPGLKIFSQKSKLNKTETQNSFFFIKYKKREMFKIFKNASRKVAYKFSDQILFDSIVVHRLQRTEAETIFRLLCRGQEKISPKHIANQIFGRKAEIIAPVIGQLCEQVTGKSENLDLEDFVMLVAGSERDEFEDISTQVNTKNILDIFEGPFSLKKNQN